MMTIDATLDVGTDTRTPVDDNAYAVPFNFTGTIDTLKIKLGPSQMAEPEKKAQAAAVAAANN